MVSANTYITVSESPCSVCTETCKAREAGDIKTCPKVVSLPSRGDIEALLKLNADSERLHVFKSSLSRETRDHIDQTVKCLIAFELAEEAAELSRWTMAS